MHRRSLLKGAISAALLNMTRSDRAESAGTTCSVAGKRLRWISPYPVAGEVVSQALVPYLEKHLGSRVVVEIAVGSGGMRGSNMIREAEPDGLTLGIIYGALDLFRNVLAGSKVGHPAFDYTILGRIHRNRHVWAVAADSRFQTIDDLIEYGETSPILVASNTPGGSDFASATITSQLLGVKTAWLTGFRAMEFAMAVVRGEADIVCINGATLVPMFQAGDLRPVLQIGREQISSAPAFDGVPLLGGPDGVAAARAGVLGRNADAAVRAADDLAAIIGAGRFVAGPPGIPDDPRRCLDRSLYQALTDPGFQARADTMGLILDVADGETALADMRTAAEQMEQFLPDLREALKATGHTGRG